MVPDPTSPQSLIAWQMRHNENFGRFVLEWGKTLRNLMGLAGGRAQIRRSVRLAVA